MPVVLHWFLPTTGDSRTIVGADHRGGPHTHQPDELRAPDIEYLAQIARSAEQLGFTGVLTPTGTWCEDAWLTTAALTRETERLKFLVAFRPGSVSPTLAAQMAATYQRLSRGRLLLNVVTGGDAAEQQRFGDWASHDERYARTEEFLRIVRGAWSGTLFDFRGDHYEVAGATVSAPPDPDPGPVLRRFLGRRAPDRGRPGRRLPDLGRTAGRGGREDRPGPPARRAAGRRLRFGIRLHTISRDRAVDAWVEAARFLSSLDPAVIARAQASLRASESVGQQRMVALHGGSGDNLEISPNLWAGVGLVRGGAGTALVGSHEDVADRIEEYHELGVDEFIFSGYPHLEEAYWFGEGVIPVLRRRGLLDAVSPTAPTKLRVSA